MPIWVDDPFAPSAVAEFDSAIDATYTPADTWSGPAQKVVLARGTAPSLRLTPEDAPHPIVGADYEVRVGALGSGSSVSYTVAGGTLTADEDTGVLNVLWTVAQVNAFAFLQKVAADVFRTISPGTRAHVGRVLLDLAETHHGGF